VHKILRVIRFPSSVWLDAGYEQLTVKVKLCALCATLTASRSPRAGRHTDDGQLWSFSISGSVQLLHQHKQFRQNRGKQFQFCFRRNVEGVSFDADFDQA